MRFWGIAFVRGPNINSLMDTTLWDYRLGDGQPKPETVEVMQILEAVLEVNLDHAGADHFHLHVVEKERPELERVTVWDLNTAAALLHIAAEVLRGEIDERSAAAWRFAGVELTSSRF